MRTFRAALLLLVLYLYSHTANAQSPNLQLQSISSTRLTAPTFVTNANDGTGRMFILEQAGRILVVPPNSSSAAVFLDLTDRVATSTERGLLGLVFHPNFKENGRFFVDYTRKPDGTVIVSEYNVSETNPNVANTHENIILSIPHPNAEHNGGMLAFGQDGFLYISVGDGGNGNDPSNHAQDLNSLLGKILRIDIDNTNGGPYSSPPSNPLYGSTAGRDEIYAFGFRNPWRFSFDPVTNELYVGDVGQDAVEEIDVVQAGGNYGWRVFEGWLCTNLGPAPCILDNYILPIDTYVHTGPSGRCSVTGGYVYRGDKQTLPYGAYIFGDYCTGEILMFYHGEEKLLLRTTKHITSFGVDEEGEIYVAGGTVDRIVNAGTPFTPATTFTISGGGGLSLDTTGPADELNVRHAQIHSNDENAKTTGIAFITLRQNGVLVNEAAVPTTSLMANGRFYGEIDSRIDTGVAIANADMAITAAIRFDVTDTDGNDLGGGVIRVPPGGQFVSFLNEDPFLLPNPFEGTVTLNSEIPISVIALRGLVNERAEFLMTTVPVTDLDSVATAAVIVPQFATGGGWSTDIVLLNPTDNALTGTLRFFSPEGRPQNANLDGTTSSAKSYSIAPRSSKRIVATGSDSTSTGSLTATPDAQQAAPTVATIYTYMQGGITVSATGSIAGPLSTAVDIYTQVDGQFGTSGSIQTGVAIANPTTDTAAVTYALTGLDGSATGIEGTLSIPANGQQLSFVGALKGRTALPPSFKGVLHLSSSTPIAALAIRGRYNERGEFLLSTTPPADPVANGDNTAFIPDVVDGAGYSTEIVIYDLDGSPLTGNIYFFDQSGQALDPSVLESLRFTLPVGLQ